MGHLRHEGVDEDLEREDVAAEGALRLRVHHLDHHALARRAQPRSVRLADGGAANGRLVEAGEDPRTLARMDATDSERGREALTST